MGTRRILSKVLTFLSGWAIAKHGMKLVVVAGRHGTKLTGELLAEMMSPDYPVRRQLERPFWDYSIPLAILGFEDRRYSFPGWIFLITRSFVRLLFGRSNFTWTILQMSTYKKEIAEYWAGLIEPEISVLVNESSGSKDLERLIAKRTKKFIIASSSLIKKAKLQVTGKAAVGKQTVGRRAVGRQAAGKQTVGKVEIISIGDSRSDNLKVESVSENGKGIKIRAVWKENDEGIDVFAFQKGEFMVEPLLSAIAVLLKLGFSNGEISERLLQVQIDFESFIFSARELNGKKG